MALKEAKLQLPFGKGIAEHVSESLVAPGKLLVAEQALITKDGSIAQRPGTDYISTPYYDSDGSTSTLDEAAHIIPDGRSTVITTPYRCLTYQETDEYWRDLDHAYEADVRRVVKGLRNHDAVSGNHNFDMAYHSAGLFCMAFCSTNEDKVYVRFIDYETESISLEATYDIHASQSQKHVRVVPCGQYIHVFWYDQTYSAIMLATFDSADIETAPAAVQYGANAYSNSPFDAVSVDSKVYLVYHWNSGETQLHRVIRSSDCTCSSTTYKDVSFRVDGVNPCYPNTAYGIDVHTDACIHVAYTFWNGASPATGVDAFGLYDDATMVLLFGPLNMDSGAASSDCRIEVVANATASKALVVWDQQATSGTSYARRLNASFVTDAGVVTNVHRTYHVGLASRPWIWNNAYYCVGFVWNKATYTATIDDQSVSVDTWQRNAYVLELRIGTREVVEA